MNTVQQHVFAATANSTLSSIRKSTAIWSTDTTASLYLVLSRLHLEYSGQIWVPQDKKDTDILEWVQHMSTKMFWGWSM